MKDPDYFYLKQGVKLAISNNLLQHLKFIIQGDPRARWLIY